MERRLAAILAADMVGYSRLMGRDEIATLTALKAIRGEVIDPKIAEHKGRVFKATGDGVLAEFSSVVNAVTCAVDIQKGVESRNAATAGDMAIALRIGVNLGDIIVEGEDVFGDGVNVAARLEEIALPGGVAVSGTVRDHLGNRLDLQFEEMGEQHFKNIERPIGVFHIQAGTSSGTPPQNPGSQGKPAIAVLPFTNLSGDPEQQYFSDGITEDIITELSRFHGLSVSARNTSFQFRDRASNVKHLGRELGARYLVEGSVRRIGDRVRITAQLIDTVSGAHLWAEHYDRDQHEIFAVQDEVVSTIVGTLAGRLDAVGTAVAKRKPPSNLMAYDCVLRGSTLPVGDRASEAEARRLYERAIQLDPDYGLAYALLAYSYAIDWFADTAAYASTLGRAIDLGKKSIKLDNTSSDCNQIFAWICLLDHKFDLSEQYYKQALELNPNSPYSIVGMAEWFAYVGRHDEALVWLHRVKCVDPHFNPPWWWRSVGLIHMFAQRFEEAIAAFQRSPNTPDWTHAYMAACYALLGRSDDAKRHVEETLRANPDFTFKLPAAKEPLKHERDRQALVEALRRAGLPE